MEGSFVDDDHTRKIMQDEARSQFQRRGLIQTSVGGFCDDMMILDKESELNTKKRRMEILRSSILNHEDSPSTSTMSTMNLGSQQQNFMNSNHEQQQFFMNANNGIDKEREERLRNDAMLRRTVDLVMVTEGLSLRSIPQKTNKRFWKIYSFLIAVDIAWDVGTDWGITGKYVTSIERVEKILQVLKDVSEKDGADLDGVNEWLKGIDNMEDKLNELFKSIDYFRGEYSREFKKKSCKIEFFTEETIFYMNKLQDLLELYMGTSNTYDADVIAIKTEYKKKLKSVKDEIMTSLNLNIPVGGNTLIYAPGDTDAEGKKIPKQIIDFYKEEVSCDFFFPTPSGPISWTTMTHIARCPQALALNDEKFKEIMDVLSCRSDPRFLSHNMAILLMGLSEDPIIREAAAKIFSCIENINLVYMNLLISDKANEELKKRINGATEKAIVQIHRSRIVENCVNKDDSNGVMDFFNMDLHHFISRIHLIRDTFSASSDEKSHVNIIASMKESFYSFVDGDDERKKIFGKTIEIFTEGYLYNEEETSNSYVFKKFKEIIDTFSTYNGETSDISNDRYKLFNKAQQLDYYYSNLVRGAAVGVSISRVWASAERPGPGKLDDKMFSDIAWEIIQKLKPEWTMQSRIMTLRGMSAETEGQQMVSIVKRMRDLRDAMVGVWDESRKYRISDEVHVIEVQVLSRLKRDGLIQWFDEQSNSSTKKLTVLETCNWFRRHDSIRNQFAMTVGKRLASESMVSTNRSTILNHQRTTNWSEREYAMLYQKVTEMESFISDRCFNMKDDEYYYVDYLKIQDKNEHREQLEKAEDRVRSGKSIVYSSSFS